MSRVSWLLQPYEAAMDWLVHTGNAQLFHFRETLVPVNGSGDTSYAYARLCVLPTLAATACLIWSVLDRKRAQYERAAYWLRWGAMVADPTGTFEVEDVVICGDRAMRRWRYRLARTKKARFVE